MPVRNESGRVKATMEAILASSRLPDEIIIADGLSDDDTVAQFLAYQKQKVPIKVVENHKIYSGGGRNAGVSASSGEIIVFTDCGNPVAQNWLAEMLRPFEEQENVDIVCGVFEPLVTTDYEHCVAAIQYAQNYQISDYTELERNELIPRIILPGGGTIAMTRETFNEIEGYPEWLHRAQDKLFSRKAYALGKSVVVNFNARIAHHMRSNPKEVFKLTYEYGRGNGRSRYLNPHFFKLILVYGVIVILLLFSFLFAKAGLLSLIILVAYSLYSGLRKVIHKDQKLQKIQYIWLTPAVLFPRDLGVIFGHLVGWTEWFILPKFKRLFNQYMKNCDPEKIIIIDP